MGREAPQFSQRAKQAWVLFFVVFPLAPMTAYLAISRGLIGGWSAATDYLALTISVGVGLGGVWMLPYSRVIRAFLALVYSACAILLLLTWSLGFVCAAFGDCL